MIDLRKINNPYGDAKVIDACSIFGAMDQSGACFSGDGVIRAITNMHDRGNGLGGGFAIYGLYPQFADQYAFHIMYLNRESKGITEAYLKERFHLTYAEEIPARITSKVTKAPLIWRYFLDVERRKPEEKSDEDYVVEQVMAINTTIKDAYVFSCGKNMGVFKGVGYPEDIAEYFRLEQYKGYIWTAHGRFPTNTPGWWGGAHPFCLLEWTVVHNGEISSYGINRRYLEQFGYHCTMQTDTEVIAYAVDLLVRRHNLPVEMMSRVLAPPLWSDIERRPAEEQALMRTLRQVYGSLLLNGPFTIIIARQGEMIGLTDRIRLRPMVVGTKGEMLYLSSEESAIRLICPDLEDAWIPPGGEPIIGRLKKTQLDKVPVPVVTKKKTGMH